MTHLAETPPIRSITLRRTLPSDLPFVLALEASSENAPWVLPWPETRHQDTLSDLDMRHVMIAATADGRTLGYAIIAGLRNPHRSVELVRLVIGVKRQGWGRAALRALTTKAFAEWGAHRFWLDVFSDNTRARSLYTGEGFKEEGVLREAVLCDGSFHNLVVMSVLEPEWSHGASRA